MDRDATRNSYAIGGGGASWARLAVPPTTPPTTPPAVPHDVPDILDGLAAITRDDGTIEVFAGLSTTHQSAANTSFVLQWNLRGGLFDEYPAAATDNLGRVVVVVKGSDGRLYYQREASASGSRVAVG